MLWNGLVIERHVEPPVKGPGNRRARIGHGWRTVVDDMTDGGTRLGIRTRLGTGASNPAGRVGEPNVLSDAAIPNRLSSEVARPANVSTLVQAPTARPVTPGVLRSSSGPTAPVPVDPEPTGRRPLTFQTLIVIGFVLLTLFRLLSQFLDGR
jgi:hypothetical protein